MDKKVSGVLAAVPTPFDTDFNPDFDLFMEHCEWALASGCDGLNVLGTTGEANSQSNRARAAIMRAAARSSLRQYPLMVGTGTPALADTIELTALAAELGFDAALLLPPYYYKPVPDDGLFNYFAAVIDAVADTDIGIYLYNFPQLTGLSFSTDLVTRLIDAYPSHMRGMKDSSGNLDYTQQMAASFGAVFDVFPGSEAPLPDAVKHGYAGCISASVNATAALAARVWQQRAAPVAEDVVELRELRSIIQSVPMVAAVKTLVARRTGNAAWHRLLPPLTPLDETQQKKIASLAERL
ncbi:MAG: dihydrodipicolinate synthase family protein [Gammaproteobacteria bacterium]|nr:dihydrodipicolinate synthase family protein [Gammaproteobacteria bacterium]MDH5303828.1 dihydrodipicolinate synthase family protein [Gammaproteobacteria bacterium]MDH5322309.1 dihydrodipicolinate synthase family protein [Gammaproteobacteria bacterium]